jgi:fructan beta-fructosidase
MKKALLVIAVYTMFVFSVKAQMDYRPKYHYSPPKNWVNDPNGLVYLDGEYHLFYQYNPFGDKWGHMSWGHAISKDLKNWKTLPTALKEFNNADGTQTMIFSGCAVVDSLNTSQFFPKGFKKGMVAVFTSHIDKNGKGIAQHQSLAYSSDKGRTWKMYDKNPVLNIGLTDFRDPNVIWYAERQVWIMSVVKSLEYTVQFYESKDLKKWDLLSEFGKKGDTTRIWECPSLVKVPVEGSKNHKWILMISSGHRQDNYLGMQYFVGDFDGKNFISQKQEEVFYLDEGKDFYAAVPFFNLPKSQKNPVIIGWLNDWEYAREIPTSGYRGAFSVPRKISLYNENGIYKLRQAAIVKEGISTEKITINANQTLKTELSKFNNNSYRLMMTISLLDSKGFDLHLLKNASNSSILSYDIASNTLAFDRTNSGNVDFNKRFSSIEKVMVKPENNQLKLDILVDKSVVEIYANDGKALLTDLVFPLKESSSIEIVWKK